MENNLLRTVVSDAGPLIHLAQIGQLQLLKNLFKRISITAKVKNETVDEGINHGFVDAQIIGKAIQDGWITVEYVCEHQSGSIDRLVTGENISHADAETLLVAKNKNAELLVDDKVVAGLAKMYGLSIWNTWTILLESLGEGLIEIQDINSAIEELGQKRHKLSEKQAEEILKAANTIVARKKKTD
jgi:predicted nucleic acid-binding protein